MGERRALIEGLKETPAPLDTGIERSFVYNNRPQPTATSPAPVGRISLSTRIRADFGTALKRASLERQLNQIQPSTLQDILEEAIEPWLRANGYLS
jgi:hypothetical protein